MVAFVGSVTITSMCCFRPLYGVVTWEIVSALFLIVYWIGLPTTSTVAVRSAVSLSLKQLTNLSSQLSLEASLTVSIKAPIGDELSLFV